MSWVLFNEGGKRPFKSQLARLIWALILGLFSGTLAVLMGIGAVEAASSSRGLGDTIISGFFTLGFAFLTAACGVAAVQAIRALRRR